MNEHFEHAREELKRVDHLIFVSLKYTRTVDVLQSVISRLVDAYDQLLTSLFVCKKGEDYLEELPASPKVKCDSILALYPGNEHIKEIIDFYLYLRKVKRSHFTKSNEYRRHVTMRVKTPDGEEIDINIDVVNDLYKKAKVHFENAHAAMKQ